VFAFVFLQETITPLMVVGMTLVLAGVFVVQWQAKGRGPRDRPALRCG